MGVLVGKPAPDFDVAAVLGTGEIVDSYKRSEAMAGKYGLVFFYPLDFTFVCPSELIALDHRMDKFRELGVEVDREYVVSGGLWGTWNRSHKGPGSHYPSPVSDTGIDLAHAIIRNPDMKVLVQQGYYDLATPVRATEYFIDQMPLPDALRSNVSMEYYHAGHMMYVHGPSLKKLKSDLVHFYKSATRN